MDAAVAARLAAALADRYRIERELGHGGMATVYLAEDLKHDRKVALKVLKPELAAVLGAERFVVEIKTTAALQHPHILPLFDSGEADGFLFYVMPFIDGETLRAKLDRETQLGVDEAVKIATEVADALQYAHEHGVIHRDIKPENILLQSGRPMVADFGIALAVSAAAGGRMTETGLSLGTPHYMSPEQATAEKEITARSDVYSLASVLYEMLAGQPPHLGGSAQQIIMKIIAEPVPVVTQFRKTVPPNVAAAVAKALEKLPADRFATAKDFAQALQDRHYGSDLSPAGLAAGGRRASNRMLLAVSGIAAVAIAVAGWALATRTPGAAGAVLRVGMELPDGMALAVTDGSPSAIALAPSGSFMVFIGEPVESSNAAERGLWRRRRNELEATSIPGTEGALGPFISGDERRLGFGKGGSLMVADLVDGGPPLAIPGKVDVRFGADFAPDGSVYASAEGVIVRIPLEGDSLRPVSSLDPAGEEDLHAMPQVLPNGKGVIFTVLRRPNSVTSLFDVAVLDLRTGKHRVLTKGVVGRYARGFLVVVRADGVLVAARFDEAALAMVGPLVPIASNVGVGNYGTVSLAFGADGTLAYVTGDARSAPADLIWVSRGGVVTPAAPSWHASFDGVALSPDERRLAVSVVDGDEQDVWVKDLDGPPAKVSVGGSRNRRPTWFPDGSRLIFVSDDSVPYPAVSRRADGTGTTEVVVRETRSLAEAIISPDGQWVIWRTSSSTAGNADILGRRLSDTVVTPLMVTEAGERHPTLSPDSRFIAYRSSESGGQGVFVRPFPNTNDHRWVVASGDGGGDPVWSRSGQEIFFVDRGKMFAVPVSWQPTFSAGRPQALFDLPSGTRPNASSQRFDVTRDGQRFLMIRDASAAGGGRREQLVFVSNFVEELRSKVRGAP